MGREELPNSASKEKTPAIVADSTANLVKFLKVLGNHPTNFPGARSMVDGTFELDKASIQKLREYSIKQGVKAHVDGLVEAQIAGWLVFQISESVWVRILINPKLLDSYRFELFLQKMGLDLRAILRVHDQFEPARKPETCPRCGSQVLDGEEASDLGVVKNSSWPDYGGSKGDFGSRWPTYG